MAVPSHHKENTRKNELEENARQSLPRTTHALCCISNLLSLLHESFSLVVFLPFLRDALLRSVRCARSSDVDCGDAITRTNVKMEKNSGRVLFLLLSVT